MHSEGATTMQTKEGISIFWLGLLGFILFPLGIIAIILGCCQLKHKTATSWTKAGLALGVTSTIFAVAMLAFIMFIVNIFSPPHKAVPLTAPIPTLEVHPPFETPQDYVTGYNQLIQEVAQKGGIGLVDIKISSYFDASDNVLQSAQRDLDSYHKLFLAISDKLGAAQAKEFEGFSSTNQLPFIRPQTLLQESDRSYDAIDTDGNNVLLTYVSGKGWKREVSDGMFMDMFKTVMKPLSGIIDSITQRVQNGELKTNKSIEVALEKEIDKIKENTQ